MPRGTWLDGRVAVLIEEFAASGMHLDRDRAAVVIKDRVGFVAERAGVTELTARRYFDDEDVRGIARQLLFEFVDEQPGADLMVLPRTVPMPSATVGRTLTALAEAMQVRAANQTGDPLVQVVAMGSQLISALGQMLADSSDRPAGRSNDFLFPQALLRRAARYLRVACHDLAGGGKLPAGLREDERSTLVTAMQQDAYALIALAEGH